MRHIARTLVCLAVGLLALAPGRAAAQSEGRFALGLEGAVRATPDEHVSSHVSLGPLWRFGHGHDGWGWQYGLGWYTVDLQQPLGASLSDFGKLSVRPFLGGYGYSHRAGRTLVTGRLLAGYSFNSFTLRPSYNDAYRSALGASTVVTEVSHALVVKPEISAWVDLSRKVGLNITAGYTIARPEVTVVSSLGRDTRTVRADVFTFKVGAVYSLF